MTATLVCLHGWGGSKESFTELREALAGADVEILTPDLPGFGEEPEPATAWTIDDYAAWAEKWITAHRKETGPLFLLGHSHGGRTAIKMALRKNIQIDHLYLCAAAGIRHARHFKRMIGLTLAKTGAFFLAIPGLNRLAPLGKKLLYKLVRVHDYEKASPVMRQTLINVTQEDLSSVLSSVTIPTDLFWGEDDGMTPLSDGRLMNERMPRSQLHTYPGVRHRVHRDRAMEIAKVIREMLKMA